MVSSNLVALVSSGILKETVCFYILNSQQNVIHRIFQKSLFSYNLQLNLQKNKNLLVRRLSVLLLRCKKQRLYEEMNEILQYQWVKQQPCEDSNVNSALSFLPYKQCSHSSYFLPQICGGQKKKYWQELKAKIGGRCSTKGLVKQGLQKY